MLFFILFIALIVFSILFLKKHFKKVKENAAKNEAVAKAAYPNGVPFKVRIAIACGIGIVGALCFGLIWGSEFAICFFIGFVVVYGIIGGLLASKKSGEKNDDIINENGGEQKTERANAESVAKKSDFKKEKIYGCVVIIIVLILVIGFAVGGNGGGSGIDGISAKYEYCRDNPTGTAKWYISTKNNITVFKLEPKDKNESTFFYLGHDFFMTDGRSEVWNRICDASQMGLNYFDENAERLLDYPICLNVGGEWGVMYKGMNLVSACKKTGSEFAWGEIVDGKVKILVQYKDLNKVLK